MRCEQGQQILAAGEKDLRRDRSHHRFFMARARCVPPAAPTWRLSGGGDRSRFQKSPYSERFLGDTKSGFAFRSIHRASLSFFLSFPFAFLSSFRGGWEGLSLPEANAPPLLPNPAPPHQCHPTTPSVRPSVRPYPFHRTPSGPQQDPPSKKPSIPPSSTLPKKPFFTAAPSPGPCRCPPPR